MSDTDVATALPLHERTIVKTILYFYCSKCRREKPFSLALRALHRIRRSGVLRVNRLEAVPPLPPAAPDA